jgi:hypothetical protein
MSPKPAFVHKKSVTQVYLVSQKHWASSRVWSRDPLSTFCKWSYSQRVHHHRKATLNFRCMAGARRLQPVSNGEHTPIHWFPSQSESTTGNFGFLSQGWGRDFLLDSWVFSFSFLGSLAYIFCKKLCIFIYVDTGLQRGLCISIMLNDPDFNRITWIGNNYILHLFSLTKWLYTTLLQSLCVCVGGGMVVGKDNIRYLIDTRQLWQHSSICQTEFHSWTGDWLCQMVTCNVWKTIVNRVWSEFQEAHDQLR